MQIEPNELGFWSLKSSLLDSSLLHWNQVHYTRFIRDPTSHCFTLFFGHVDIKLESNGLEFYIHVANSIFMNGHQPFHMWHVGPSCDLFSHLQWTQVLYPRGQLDFYEWSPALPHVALWVPAVTFFPIYLSHSVSSTLTPSLQLSQPSSLSHNFPQLSHPLTQHSPQQHSLTSNVFIYICTLVMLYIYCVMFLQYWEYFLLVNIVIIC